MTIATLTLSHTYNGDSAATQYIDCAALDTDLGNIVAAINNVTTTYSATLKADGTLQDGSVHANALADDVRTLIEQWASNPNPITISTSDPPSDLADGAIWLKFTP